MRPVKLASVPDAQYSDYRYEVIFKSYKWDPQVGDQNTVSKYAALMDGGTAAQISSWAEKLSRETMLMEEVLVKNPALAKKLFLPKKLEKVLGRLSSYDPNKHVRFMRFDFHPTAEGWAVSEVNSDVPGGIAEGSVWPQIAARYFDGYQPYGHAGNKIYQAFKDKIKDGMAAFVHCTSYSDDRQVVQYLHDIFKANGVKTLFAAPDHIRRKDKKAFSIAEGAEGPVDAIIRYFPLEWLTTLPKNADWRGYWDAETASCNHPAAIFAQSKRLPLIWDGLGVNIETWKQLLPETRDPREVDFKDEGWIYKPALGRVGAGISIKEAVTPKEYSKIRKAAKRHPREWVAQRIFKSAPLTADDGKAYHLCLGAFTVDGKSAGFYGRLSPHARIDVNAIDIPILVKG